MEVSLPEDDEAAGSLEALLETGYNSGPSTELTCQDWDDIEKEACDLLNARKTA